MHKAKTLPMEHVNRRKFTEKKEGEKEQSRRNSAG